MKPSMYIVNISTIQALPFDTAILTILFIFSFLVHK